MNSKNNLWRRWGSCLVLLRFFFPLLCFSAIVPLHQAKFQLRWRWSIRRRVSPGNCNLIAFLQLSSQLILSFFILLGGLLASCRELELWHLVVASSWVSTTLPSFSGFPSSLPPKGLTLLNHRIWYFSDSGANMFSTKFDSLYLMYVLTGIKYKQKII